jgi:hypothetical protein
MTRSALPPLVTVLMLVAACPTLAAAQALLVQVDNDTRIPAADLAQMEQVVARSYRAIGVYMIWEHGEVPLDNPRGRRVHLRLLSRAQADRKILGEQIGTAVLGQTNRPARLACIFCYRIVEASMKFAHDYTHILGLVVAHELGHVLLPAGSHPDSGVMKGRANFWGKIAHETPEEGEAIRDALVPWESNTLGTEAGAVVPGQQSFVAPDARVRGVSSRIVAIVNDAIPRSKTFRALVDQINRTDGMVYVAEGDCGSGVRACLLLTMTLMGPHRLLRILVDPRATDRDLMASIGHELQHALEVLDHRWVRNSSAMILLYKKICNDCGRRFFETNAAVRVGTAVRDELRESAAPSQ